MSVYDPERGMVDEGAWSWFPPAPWGGRVDDPDDPAALRWHECVRLWDGRAPEPPAPGRKRVWLIGCATDIGIARNKGRRGAASGPRAIRAALANLPRHSGDAIEIVDSGDLAPRGDDLEGLLSGLADIVAAIVASGGFPLVLGGGHEIAYGTYEGIRRGLPASGGSGAAESAGRPPRILSFDAHFDLRPVGPSGASLSSGNMFRHIANDCSARGEEFDYSVAGIQRSANTQSLFEYADSLGVGYLPARDIAAVDDLLRFIAPRIAGDKPVHATLCVDVLSAAHAPAVSAPQPFGLDPAIALEGLRLLARSGRVAGLDIAEVSPRYEGDNGTACLVAILVFAWINAMAGLE